MLIINLIAENNKVINSQYRRGNILDEILQYNTIQYNEGI